MFKLKRTKNTICMKKQNLIKLNYDNLLIYIGFAISLKKKIEIYVQIYSKHLVNNT